MRKREKSLGEQGVARLKKHLKGRRNEKEVDDYSQHIDIVLLISILSHGSIQTLSQIPEGNFSYAISLFGFGEAHTTQLNNGSYVILLLGTNSNK